MEDIMKIVKSLLKSGSFIKDDSKKIENESKEQNFLASYQVLRNMLAGKRARARNREWTVIIGASEEKIEQDIIFNDVSFLNSSLNMVFIREMI